jgi:hypothetical protein
MEFPFSIYVWHAPRKPTDKPYWQEDMSECVAMREVDQRRFIQLRQELERRAKEEPPPLQRRQDGATIVDATVVQPSTPPASPGQAKAQKPAKQAALQPRQPAAPPGKAGNNEAEADEDLLQ